MSVIVLGSINTDLVIRSARLPLPGETVLGGTFFQAPGGKGANQAVAAARAGRERVVFLAAVGDDAFGRASLQNLAGENLDCTYIKSLAGHASGVALIMVDERGENAISVAGGANLALRPEDVDAVPDDVFRRAKVFLACFESPLDAVRRVLERARSAGLITVLNPAPALPIDEVRDLLPQVDVLTPNEREAQALTGVEVDSNESAIRSARKLLEMGCKSVIVTLGKDGAVAVDAQRQTTIAAREVTAIDTTAAGDCFSGALAVALAEGQELFSAAEWASIAAGISVTRLGAQPSLPTREQIEVVRAASQFS